MTSDFFRHFKLTRDTDGHLLDAKVIDIRHEQFETIGDKIYLNFLKIPAASELIGTETGRIEIKHDVQRISLDRYPEKSRHLGYNVARTLSKLERIAIQNAEMMAFVPEINLHR